MKIRSNISNCAIHFLKIDLHAASDNCCACIYFLIFLRETKNKTKQTNPKQTTTTTKVSKKITKTKQTSKQRAVAFPMYLSDMKIPSSSATTHKETFLCKKCGKTMFFDLHAVLHRKNVGRLKLLYQSGCTQYMNSSSQYYCIQKASQECSSSLSRAAFPKHRGNSRDENTEE